ncbi:MAG: hypothetical protein EXX96DRAFT_615048 [Benjaminiella poitrasii]|nr:MAG: hypothetical protein EXX96DRAFT_615048 [Benjaminiella poitrasii]
MDTAAKVGRSLVSHAVAAEVATAANEPQRHLLRNDIIEATVTDQGSITKALYIIIQRTAFNKGAILFPKLRNINLIALISSSIVQVFASRTACSLGVTVIAKRSTSSDTKHQTGIEDPRKVSRKNYPRTTTRAFILTSRLLGILCAIENLRAQGEFAILVNIALLRKSVLCLNFAMQKSIGFFSQIYQQQSSQRPILSYRGPVGVYNQALSNDTAPILMEGYSGKATPQENQTVKFERFSLITEVLFNPFN